MALSDNAHLTYSSDIVNEFCQRFDTEIAVNITYRVGLGIITSVDRKEWTSIGTIWAPGEDVWTNNYTLTADGTIWAPDCHYMNDEFWVSPIS